MSQPLVNQYSFLRFHSELVKRSEQLNSNYDIRHKIFHFKDTQKLANFFVSNFVVRLSEHFPKVFACYLRMYRLFLRQLETEKLDKLFIEGQGVSMRIKISFVIVNSVSSSCTVKPRDFSPISQSKMCSILAFNKYFKIDCFAQQCYFLFILFYSQNKRAKIVFIKS